MEMQLLVRLFSDATLVRALIFAVVTTCMLTGCAGSNMTATPYKAAATAGEEGYSSHRLSEDKYKILFKANPATSEQTMKQYSQQRAQEIGLQQDYTWYRIVSSESVSMPAMTDQQVLTAAPQSNTVDGAVTGEVDTTALPANQQCTMSGCEQVTTPNPVAGEVTDTGAQFYAMTIQFGRFKPLPQDAIPLR
ncbi:hypothetical protein [uncultured Alteromonas sp.]|jgi:hypothetical protein|uniref:CC0125/CC1285 family lipoprotein n=1 Tax=uncultured Alteromonas sp. TaxID=179113 RepID=UPI0025D50D1A|nr:hypothetical protein [uncultured Alteromonas sp.]